MNPPKAYLGTKEGARGTIARICCKCETKAEAGEYAEKLGIPRERHSHTFCEECHAIFTGEYQKERAA